MTDNEIIWPEVHLYMTDCACAPDYCYGEAGQCPYCFCIDSELPCPAAVAAEASDA